MKKVSEVIELHPTATFPRAVKMNKGLRKGKTPEPCKHVTDEKFRLKINGGSFGNMKKLHDHGFKLGKYGIIICTLCPQIIDLPNNTIIHTEEFALHNLKYRLKNDGALKLHHQSIQMIYK